MHAGCSTSECVECSQPRVCNPQGAVCARAEDDPSRGVVTRINDADFDHFVSTHELVMVDFYADWCRCVCVCVCAWSLGGIADEALHLSPPFHRDCRFCQMLKPVFEATARELQQHDRVRLAAVDCEDPGGSAECSITVTIHKAYTHTHPPLSLAQGLHRRKSRMESASFPH